MRDLTISFVSILLGVAGTASGQTTLTWAVGQDGDWAVPENWSPENVPDATSEAVELSVPGAYTVSLFQRPSVHNLQILNPEATLAIEGGGFVGVGLLVNDGLIRLKTQSGMLPARLYFYVGQTLSGTGEVRMEGDTLLPTIGSEVPFTQVAPHRITGAGSIGDGFINDSLILANVPGKKLTVNGSFPKTNNGVMQAENGGILEFDGGSLAQGSNGVIRADGGVVRFVNMPRIIGGRLSSVNGGTATALTTLRLDAVACDADLTVPALEFYGPEFHNSGIIRNPTTGSGSFRIHEDTLLAGGGELRLSNWRIDASPPATLTQAADHRIVGRGLLVTPIVNYGLIETSGPGASLQNSGSFADIENHGIIRVKDGAMFQKFAGALTGDGVWVADGGTILMNSLSSNISAGGPTQIIHGGQLRVFGAGGWSAGDLTIDATSLLLVSVRMALSGNYRIEQQDESRITWSTDSALFMSGGSGASCSSASWATIEVGGRDGGASGTGSSNFGMENIVVMSDAAVALVDVVDNGNRAGPMGVDEALYAAGLTLESGATLNLNGLKLYVNGVQIAVGPFGDGIVIDEPVYLAGDLNCDGTLDGDDVAAYVVAAVSQSDYPTQYPGCSTCAADMDGDGLIATGDDLSLFAERLTTSEIE